MTGHSKIERLPRVLRFQSVPISAMRRRWYVAENLSEQMDLLSLCGVAVNWLLPCHCLFVRAVPVNLFR